MVSKKSKYYDPNAHVWKYVLGDSNLKLSHSDCVFDDKGSIIVSASPSDNKINFKQSVDPAGGAETIFGDPESPKPGINRLHYFGSDGYVDGHGFFNGGPGDSRTVGPSREQTDGVSALAARLARMEAALQKIELFKQGKSSVAGSSDASNYEFITADKNVNYEKNSHIGIEGNSVKTVGGTELIMNKGQFTRDVQGGNWEVRVNTGEGKIYSPTKLTFQVGTSTIVMEPNKITITADRIDLNP